MTERILTQLYKIIDRILPLLENDLNELEEKQLNNPKLKKSLTDMLNKIVILMLKLKQLESSNHPDLEPQLEEDKILINNFLNSYNCKNSFL